MAIRTGKGRYGGRKRSGAIAGGLADSLYRVGVDPPPSFADGLYRVGVDPPPSLDYLGQQPGGNNQPSIGQQPGGNNQPIIGPQLQKLPLLPIPKTPFPVFPDKGEFRLGGYFIIEELDDYLICKGFDPNAKNPLGGHTPSAHKTIKIAKPSLLLKTPWDGETVNLIVGGVSTEVTFEYTGIGLRIARAEVDGEDVEELQRITMDYIVDDIIMAVELRKTGAVDGIDVYSEDGGRLSWVDINMSGRCWAVEEE